MTRAQYLALCIIGAVAGLAYLQSYRIAKVVQSMRGGTARGSAEPLTL